MNKNNAKKDAQLHTKPRKRPIFIATVFLLVCALGLTFAAYVVGTSEYVNSDRTQAPMVNIILFLTASVVGLLSYILSIVNIADAERGHRAKHVLLNVGIPLLGIAALALGAWYMNSVVAAFPGLYSQQQAASNTPPQVVQDESIVALLNSFGAKGGYADLNMRWSDDIATDCKWEQAGGCYLVNETGKWLVLNRSAQADFLKTAAAHEYLHYIWYTMSLSNDHRLASDLINFYAKNPIFQQRIGNHYVDVGSLEPTEFFSYGCTEVSDAELGVYVAERCNQYIDTAAFAARY